jgi:hypothetical protein
MQDEQASAPQIVDLDRDGQRAASSPQSVANLSLYSSSSSSLIPDAPLVSEKRASRRAQRYSTASNLNPTTTPSSSSPTQVDSLIASHPPFSDSHPHASSRRDPDLTTDSQHKGLRPKSSYHQSLLNLRDELHKPSDSGVYYSCAALSVR